MIYIRTVIEIFYFIIVALIILVLADFTIRQNAETFTVFPKGKIDSTFCSSLKNTMYEHKKEIPECPT